MDVYAWLLGKDGQLSRELVFDGKLRTDRGAPLPIEKRLQAAWEREMDELDEVEDWIGEGAVMAVAASRSISPLDLTAKTKTKGKGMLAATPWGKEHGVPERSVSD
jgi:hypothetical protein